MARITTRHDLWVALNDAFPESIETIRAAMDGLIPQERIVVWQGLRPSAAIEPHNAWRSRCSEVLRTSFLASLAPDVVHVSSLFEGCLDDAVVSTDDFATPAPTAATLYDLIPLVHRDIYLRDPLVAHWYEQKLASVRKVRALLAISNHTRNQAIDLLGVVPERVVNISASADDIFLPTRIGEDQERRIRAAYGLSRKFVMYSAGIDPRKNIERLIQAYAQIDPKLRSAHQLVVVCAANGDQIQVHNRLAEKAGLGPHEFVMTGFVSDADLVCLYNLSTASVFPSWHEGFGLPALEAMRCGVPTIGANASSVPEIIGRSDALFDPYQIADIARKLQTLLSDNAFRANLAEHALSQSAKFSWTITADRALAVMQSLSGMQETKKPVTIASAAKPRLAFVSPLPPQQSGIADYSAELLRGLANYYRIDAIVDQGAVADPWINDHITIRQHGWFRRHAGEFDRILYHFGNSSFHEYMFELLREHGGIVVLHDFFLSGVQAHMERMGSVDVFARALYESHGYGALLVQQKSPDPAEAIWTYPASLPVIRQATGIVAHSKFALRLARDWYPKGTKRDWISVPMLRKAPATLDRATARRRLGVEEREFVVCSFGMMGPTKLSHRLLQAWAKSPLGRNPHCRLVFVGEESSGLYSQQCAALRRQCPSPDRVQMTGFVSPEVYREYLMSADMAVQLRGLTRGETSAAILDCMAFAVPTIVNRTGAARELDADAVLMLAEDFADDDLAAAIDTLHGDSQRRDALGARSRSHILADHTPERVAAVYAELIENLPGRSSRGRIVEVANTLAAVEKKGLLATDIDWRQAAVAVAHNESHSVIGQRQWLVDISELVRRDGKSGIQRAVRNLLGAWLDTPPEGFRVEPVYFDEKGAIRYARHFTTGFLGLDSSLMNDDVLESSGGDILIAVDLFLEPILGRTLALRRLRDSGIGIYFVLYDLLPVLRPDFFPEGGGQLFANWLDASAHLADGMVAISRTVADQLLVWLEENRPERRRSLAVGAFRLGVDKTLIEGALRCQRRTENTRPIAGANILTVGTIEPRKGHGQALAAFESLWARGEEIHWTIVGKQGWLMESLAQRLREHPELGKRLQWHESASDDELATMYGEASGVLVPSLGEGFGLPLIEAAQYRTPLLVRDIPVFREVAGTGAAYFSGSSSEDLAAALEVWLVAIENGSVAASDVIEYAPWEKSAADLADMIIRGRWLAHWQNKQDGETA